MFYVELVLDRNIEIRVHCKDMRKRVSSCERHASSGSGYYLDWWVSVTGYGCVGVSKLLGSITTPTLILP